MRKNERKLLKELQRKLERRFTKEQLEKMSIRFNTIKWTLNVEMLIGIVFMLCYSGYHYLFLSTSYYDDNKTDWILIPIFVSLALMLILQIVDYYFSKFVKNMKE